MATEVVSGPSGSIAPADGSRPGIAVHQVRCERPGRTEAAGQQAPQIWLIAGRKDFPDSGRKLTGLDTHMDEGQRSVCERYGADFTPTEETYKVGISESAMRGEVPLHGLRHPPESGTSGWFIWSGEYSDADDFFKPVHLYHLIESCAAALPFLALPPGWRFLVAPDYEDVWSDSSLLDT